MFQLSNVTVTAGNHTLVHNLSLNFSAGELCMIAGPNGAGKTTMLKVLAGELPPAAGSVKFHGRALHEWKKADLAKMRAILPQHSSLEFPFAVHDVVELGRLPHRTDNKINEEIILKVTELCDCDELIERPFPCLSGGEQQRVQMARILAQIWRDDHLSDRFLILDEPLSALDLSHQYDLLHHLKKMTARQGAGIICVLHNLNLAAQFADRCIIIDNGRLAADGSPMDVFTEETLSNVFDLEIRIQTHPDNAEIPLIIPRIA